MNTTEEIAVKLGIKTSEFTSALQEAGVEVKKFAEQGAHSTDGLAGAVRETHHAMRLFHQFMVAGGILEAVKGFYETAIAYAEKHKENTDDQTEAVRRFAGAMHGAKDTVGAAMTQVLGYVNQAGEGIADLWIKLTKGQEGLDAANRAQAVALQAEQNIADIAKAHAETTKEIAATMGKIENEAAAIAKAQFDLLPPTEKIKVLTSDLAQLHVDMSRLQPGTLEHARLHLEILEKTKEAVKARAEVTKEDQTKEATWNEYKELHRKSEEEFEDRAYKEKEEKAKKLIALADQETEQSLQTALGYGLVGSQISNATERLREMSAEQKRQLDALDALYARSLRQTGGPVTDLSQIQLNALLQNVTSQYNQSRQQDSVIGGVGGLIGTYVSPITSQLGSQIYNINQELELRRNFQSQLSSFGQNYVEAHFAPSDFQRLMSILNPGNTSQQLTSIASSLGTIARALNLTLYNGLPAYSEFTSHGINFYSDPAGTHLIGHS